MEPQAWGTRWAFAQSRALSSERLATAAGSAFWASCMLLTTLVAIAVLMMPQRTLRFSMVGSFVWAGRWCGKG